MLSLCKHVAHMSMVLLISESYAKSQPWPSKNGAVVKQSFYGMMMECAGRTGQRFSH